MIADGSIILNCMNDHRRPQTSLSKETSEIAEDNETNFIETIHVAMILRSTSVFCS
jgi:hypothetical protein